MTRRLAIVCGVLLLLSVWTHARPRAADVPRFDVAGTLPLAFGEWIGRDAPPLDPEVARVLAADAYVHRYYATRSPRLAAPKPEGQRRADVEIDIAYYARPEAGSAMHSPLNCLPGSGWQVAQARTAPLLHEGRTLNVRQLVVTRGEDRVAMTYWFQNRGAMVGNEYRQRLRLLANGLQGRPTDAALVRVMALDTAEGHAAMHRFAGELAAMLSAAFR